MKTTILAKQITKKHTLKINFLKTQILRFKSSSSSSCSKTRSLRVVNCNSNDVCKMNVFSRIFKHTAKILRQVLALMLTNSELKMQLQDGRQFKIKYFQNNSGDFGCIWQNRGSVPSFLPPSPIDKM